MDRWKPNVTVATVVERQGADGDKEYLLVHELREGKEVYNQPAGHLDEGESLCDAAIRETFEETGWHVKLEGLIGIYRLVAPNGITYLRHTFFASTLEHDTTATLDDGIMAAVWLSREAMNEKLHQMRSSLVTQCIDDYDANGYYPLSIFHDS